jgi:hypothetical protein
LLDLTVVWEDEELVPSPVLLTTSFFHASGFFTILNCVVFRWGSFCHRHLRRDFAIRFSRPGFGHEKLEKN